MSINAILNSVSATLAQQSAAVSVRATQSTPVISATSQPATDTAPSQSLLQGTNLLSASSSFAQLGSLLQVAQSGTEDVGAILSQLQSLVQQATNSSDVTNLSSLNSAFQQLLSQLNQTVATVKFGGSNLLDGTLSGDDNTGGLSLPDLSTGGLFGENAIDISTPQNAAAAASTLAVGQLTVNETASSIADVQVQVNFASASVNTALANSDAAASTLSESDLAQNGAVGGFADILANPGLATQAQTGNLAANLLNLLQD